MQIGRHHTSSQTSNRQEVYIQLARVKHISYSYVRHHSYTLYRYSRHHRYRQPGTRLVGIVHIARHHNVQVTRDPNYVHVTRHDKQRYPNIIQVRGNKTSYHTGKQKSQILADNPDIIHQADLQMSYQTFYSIFFSETCCTQNTKYREGILHLAKSRISFRFYLTSISRNEIWLDAVYMQ